MRRGLERAAIVAAAVLILIALTLGAWLMALGAPALQRPW